MIYAYCRVSTARQKLKRQIDNIAAAYPEIQERDFHTEKYSGTKSDRPKWQELLRKVQPGDTIVFDEVSRMSRDAAEGARQYEELYTKGVSLVFLKEPNINTDVFKAASERRIEIAIETGKESSDKFIQGVIALINELSMDLAKEQVMYAFERAQKERDFLSKRTKEGIAASKKERIAKGLPPRETNLGKTLNSSKARKVKAVILKHAKEFGGNLSDVDCILIAGCSRNSYYKYKAELRRSLEPQPMPGTDSSSSSVPDGQTSAEPESPAV